VPARSTWRNPSRSGGKLGGHLVTGHVDGVGEVLRRAGSVVAVRVPEPLAKYVAARDRSVSME
jgi:riboflavin synthase